MTPKTLRVRLRDNSPEPPPSVQNYERLDAGVNSVNCFLGLKLTEMSPGVFARVPTGETLEVPFRAEYVKALHDGDLVAADADTAKLAGLDVPLAAPLPRTTLSVDTRGDS